MAVLVVNGQTTTIDVEPDMPLLWALRDELGLVGTKFGCGAGLCGACTVMIDGEAMRSCQTPVSYAAGQIGPRPSRASGAKALHAVQKAWIEADAPQCGYCQSGQIMAAVALLAKNPQPERRRHRRRDDQHLPLRDLSAHAGGRSSGRRTRQNLREARTMTIALTRRTFIQASLSAAGGLAIAVHAPALARASSIPNEPWGADDGARAGEVGAFVVIDPDNSITCASPSPKWGKAC